MCVWLCVRLVKIQFGEKLEIVFNIFPWKSTSCVKMLARKFTAGNKCFSTFQIVAQLKLVHSISFPNNFPPFFSFSLQLIQIRFLAMKTPFFVPFIQNQQCESINKMNRICLKLKTSLVIAYVAVHSVINASFVVAILRFTTSKLQQKMKMSKFQRAQFSHRPCFSKYLKCRFVVFRHGIFAYY